MTPTFAVVGIDAPGFHMPRLWLPVFLLWIPILLLSPLIFLVLVVAAIAARTSIWRIIGLCWGVLLGLPGTDVWVRTEGKQVLVRIV